MNGFIGERKVDASETKYGKFTPADWVVLWIERYGGIDGDHHKAWLIDQTVRILTETKVLIKIAEWEDGTREDRFTLEEPPAEYWSLVKEMKGGEDGPDSYGYDFGISP